MVWVMLGPLVVFFVLSHLYRVCTRSYHVVTARLEVIARQMTHENLELCHSPRSEEHRDTCELCRLVFKDYAIACLWNLLETSKFFNANKHFLAYHRCDHPCLQMLGLLPNTTFENRRKG